MFTVIVGFDGSGKSSTLRPLGRRYSVIPSTLGPLRIAETGIGGPSFTAKAACCGACEDGGEGGRFAGSWAGSPFGAEVADSGGFPGCVPGGCAGGAGSAFRGALAASSCFAGAAGGRASCASAEGASKRRGMQSTKPA